MLNAEQKDVLFRPLNPVRVAKRQGMSYLEAWDVIAHLTRVFGFEGWDKRVLSVEQLYDDYVKWTPQATERTPNPTEKSGWDAAYRATVQIIIKDSDGAIVKIVEDVATGQAQHQPNRADAHDLALKSAVSDALKRAAKDLGNQFGLSLYDGGSTASVVGSSLAYPKEPDEAQPDQA